MALAGGLEDHLAAHYAEVDPHASTFALKIDFARYRALERAGSYKALVMRRAGKIIGYNGFFVQPMLHSLMNVWALNDVLYLKPAERKGTAAIRMIVEAETLKAKGVRQIVYGANLPPGNAGDSLCRMFEQCGYQLIEKRFSKVL